MKTFICLWFVLLVLCFMDLSLCGDPVNVTVKSGQVATLPCRAAGNGKVSVLRLTRDDLEPDSVLLYRDEQIDEEQQNPQYKGRTQLQNPTSIDGEVHLTLNNVTEKDSGVYECSVGTEIKSNTRRKRAALERTIIQLSVAAAQSESDPSPDPPGRGHSGLIAVVVTCSLVTLTALIALAAVLVLKKRESFHSLSPHDEAENPQNVDISRTFHWSSIFSHDSNPAIRKPTRTFNPDAGPQPGQMERVV